PPGGGAAGGSSGAGGGAAARAATQAAANDKASTAFHVLWRSMGTPFPARPDRVDSLSRFGRSAATARALTLRAWGRPDAPLRPRLDVSYRTEGAAGMIVTRRAEPGARTGARQSRHLGQHRPVRPAGQGEIESG